MKRLLSYSLIFLFVSHLTLSLLVNFNAFAFLKDEKSIDLNWFGRTFVNNFIFPNIVYSQLYSNFTGTDRGYGFYSPNMIPRKNQFIIFVNDKELENIMVSGEARLKFGILMTNMTDLVRIKNLREKIVLSTYYNISESYKSSKIDNMKIVLQIQKFKPLSSYNLGEKRDSVKTIDAFYINNKGGVTKDEKAGY